MSGAIYKKSPIREAIFDVRLSFSEKPELSLFETIHSKISAEYLKREVSHSQFVSFEVKPGEQPIINSGGGPNGLKLTSNDGTRVLQIRDDGFTFSKLNPYESWDKFVSEAKKLFEIYVDETKPNHADRIALRYINAVKIKEKSFKLEDYFSTYLKLDDSLPQGLVQFFSRYFIKDDQSENTFAIINQTVEENSDISSDFTTVMFDIDVFQANLKLDLDPSIFWKEIEVLKKLRTRIFEGSLTAKAKELFN